MTTQFPAHRSLFPLAPVPYELMMLQDDRLDYPMTCGAQLWFDGRFERSKFIAAVRCAVQRHPLFCANIRYRRGRPWTWVSADTLPHVRWIGDASPADYASAVPFDLRREVGLRIWVQEKDSRTKLYLDMHHACSDAGGAMGFVEDLLTAYAIEFPSRGRKTPQLCNRDPARLLQRGKFAGATGLSLRRIWNEVIDIPEVCRFFGRQPQPIAKRSVGLVLRAPDAPARFVRRFFDSQFLRQLRHSATADGASLNDLLVYALMLTVGQWNVEHGAFAPRDWLRIVVPTNLRSKEDLAMPAANRLSNLFITRRMSALSDRKSLLKSISRETASPHRERLSYGMLSKLGMLNAMRFGIPVVFSPNRCLGTAVLSNIGDPTRRFQWKFPRHRGLLVAGNVVLNGFSAVPPIRPLTRLALLINTYGDRLTVGMRLDPTCFSPTDGSVFFDAFAHYLNEGLSQTEQLQRAA